MKDASNLVASLVSQGKTADPTGAVKLIKGNIECTSCHNPHVQGTDRDRAEFSGARQFERRRCAWLVTIPTAWCRGKLNPLAGVDQQHSHDGHQPAVSPDAHVGVYRRSG